MTRVRQQAPACAQYFSLAQKPSCKLLKGIYHDKQLTRFGGNTAAAALSVSVVLTLAASARSSSKELGALRPF